MSAECPYCEREVDWEDLPDAYADEPALIKCSCGKKFHVVGFISYGEQKDCALNGDEHEWHQLFADINLEECVHCDVSRLPKNQPTELTDSEVKE